MLHGLILLHLWRRISFFFWLNAESVCIYMCVYIYIYIFICHIFFIHSSVGWWTPLRLFPYHILAILMVLQWRWKCRCLFKIVFISFEYVPKSEVAASYGSSIFNFLRSPRFVFHSGCTSLHSYRPSTRVRVSPQPGQDLLSWLFEDGHSNRGQVESPWGLIFISLMIGDIWDSL